MSATLEKITTLSANKQELFELLLQEKGLNLSRIQSIPHRQNVQRAPLSFAQTRIWLKIINNNGFVSNISIAIHLSGILNTTALEESLNTIIQRHEILRTSFQDENGYGMQIIHANADFKLSILDCTVASDELQIQNLLRAEAEKPFNLAESPLMRGSLVKISERQYYLLLTLHPLVADFNSVSILLQEIATLYEAFSNQKPSPLESLPIQYADFARWQRLSLQGKILEQELFYWKQRLESYCTRLQLPTNQKQLTTQNSRAGKQSLVIPITQARSLRWLCRAEGVTLFITLLTVFFILLYQYSDKKDILVASPFANRNRQEVTGLIGSFASLLGLRIEFSGNPTFREMLRQVRALVAEAYAHQDLSLEQIVDFLNLSRERLTPQVMFAIKKLPLLQPIPGLTLSFLDIDSETTNFDLLMLVEEEGEKLTAVLKYRAELFDEQTISEILKRFQRLLEKIIANPMQTLSELSEPRENIPDSQREIKRDELALAGIEGELAKIWKEILSVESVGVKDNFFELGGDSLLAVRLFSQIREKFNRNLPLATLFEAPTIEQLAQIIRNQEWLAPWNSLVKIQSGGKRRALFCIHALGGNVLSYKPVATYLGEDIPVYGLQSRGLDGKQEPHTSIEEMATDYIKEIRTVQPEGPYMFVGHSLGGVIAFEMAQQLVRAGEKVSLLAVLDTYSPTFKSEIPPASYQLKIHKYNLSRLTFRDKIIYILERVWWKIEDFIAKIADKLPWETGRKTKELPEHLQRIEDANRQAIHNYKPQVYPGRLTLLRALERPTRKYFDPLLGWGELVAGGVEIVEVPGHHKTLILEPRVRILAQKLRECIDKAEAQQE